MINKKIISSLFITTIIFSCNPNGSGLPIDSKSYSENCKTLNLGADSLSTHLIIDNINFVQDVDNEANDLTSLNSDADNGQAHEIDLRELKLDSMSINVPSCNTSFNTGAIQNIEVLIEYGVDYTSSVKIAEYLNNQSSLDNLITTNEEISELIKNSSYRIKIILYSNLPLGNDLKLDYFMNFNREFYFEWK